MRLILLSTIASLIKFIATDVFSYLPKSKKISCKNLIGEILQKMRYGYEKEKKANPNAVSDVDIALAQLLQGIEEIYISMIANLEVKENGPSASLDSKKITTK